MTFQNELSRRERQIMDALHRRGDATVAEVCDELDDPGGYDSIRVTLGILASKGQVARWREGRAYRYRPSIARGRVRRSAVEHLIDTFFDGSTPKAVSAMLDISGGDLATDELEQLEAMIRAERERRAR